MALEGRKENQAQPRAQVLRRSFWANRQLELVLDARSLNAFASDERISTHSKPSGASGAAYNDPSSLSSRSLDQSACTKPMTAIAAIPQKSIGLTVIGPNRSEALNPYARHLQRMRAMRVQEQRA